MNNSVGKKVFVGLSGGVDSSVSALLLKQAGYEVTGVFIKGWQPDWIPCTWMSDRISAMRTAAYLEIPFVTLDLEMQYKNKVVTYLLDEYSKGNTPNPDMLCNREIKFGSFLNWAIKNGADFVATGHYAQIHALGLAGGMVEMSESKDKEKDQTYFLSQLTQTQLAKTLFPIGHLEKKDVRKIAAKYKLPVATRKDSQGICFVGDLEMKDFLKRELHTKKGNVLNEQGEVIGEHDGAILYTIGERHGFKISNTKNENNLKHHYVVSKNILENTITVSTNIPGLQNQTEALKANDYLKVKNLSLTNSFESFKNAKNLSVRLRYRGDKLPVNIINFVEIKSEKDELENFKKIELEFKKSSLSKDLKKPYFATGQFAVFYDNEKCLGGGEIE